MVSFVGHLPAARRHVPRAGAAGAADEAAERRRLWRRTDLGLRLWALGLGRLSPEHLKATSSQVAKPQSLKPSRYTVPGAIVACRVAIWLPVAHNARTGARAAQNPARRSPTGSPASAPKRSTRGIRQEIVDAALGDVEEPLPVVIERDRAQAETVLSLETYISPRLTPDAGPARPRRRRPAPHAARQECRQRYGVPARDHRRHLGHRVELRPLQRRAADDRGARDAGLGSAPRRLLPRRAVQRARNSQSRRHRSDRA